jgi:hypothetical protein
MRLLVLHDTSWLWTDCKRLLDKIFLVTLVTQLELIGKDKNSCCAIENQG